MSKPTIPAHPDAPPPLAGVLLALLSLALYATTLGFDFVELDDGHYVFKNEHLGHGLNLETLWWAITTHHFGWWHPLTWISHLIDVRLFGLWAGGHHLTSALLHAANTWLAWRVLLALKIPPRRALLATMLFAWHPMRVESVAWISERKDVLSVLFALLTVLSWLRYRAMPGVARYLMVVTLFAAALASKAMVVTLPLVLAVLDLMQRHPARPSLRRAAFDKVPLLMMSLGAGLAVLSRQHAAGAVSSLEALSMSARLTSVPWAITRYVGKTLWPADLCVMYPRLDIESWQAITGLIVVIALTTLASALAWRGRPSVLGGWVVFLITLLPVLGIAQTGAQLLADRYTYLGHLALFAGLVLALPSDWFIQRRTSAVLLLVPLSWLALSLFQLQTWRNSDALFAQALAVEPLNPPIQKRVDALPLEHLLEAGHVQEALPEAEGLLARWPNDARVLVLAGSASARAGRFEEAIARFTQALALDPNNEDAIRFRQFANEDLELARRRGP